MITLSKGQYLSDVVEKIPSNCILSKRIPGIGATTLELGCNRNSIIVVPNVPVITCKTEKYPNLLGVYEKVTVNDICRYFEENNQHKIMTTPESFGKVKTACERSGINIHTHAFLLMDECHQLIQDVDYRDDIVLPMNDFFHFKQKALVSATPIGFSDPRFRGQGFETLEVSADYDYRQEITVTHTYNIHKAVSEYLEAHDGTVCFFVNSVNLIYSIISEFGMNATIYCAPKSRRKLKTEYHFTDAHSEWSADTIKKFNFFTGRFFTAFDLELDYQPDVVMLSDPYTAEHTMLDIDTDCIQICGRFRNGIKSATHIYRTNPNIIVKDREQIEWEISAHEHAYNTIQTLYDNADGRECRYAFGEALETLPFRKFLNADNTKNWFRIDNEICSILATNRYRDKLQIKEWYENCHFFKPEYRPCEYNENDEKLKIVRDARSVKDKRRKMVQILSEIEEPASEYVYDFKNDIRKIAPLIVEAYEVLGKERIEELKYNEKKMKEELILCQRKGNKTIRLIKNVFHVGGKYSNERIVNELTRIFEVLNIRPEKEVKPAMIKDYFQAVPCWVGKKRGYHLVSEII